MNPLSPHAEMTSDRKPSPNGLLPDLAVEWKRAVARASGMSIYCAQTRAWREHDGV
jgi:hypothetical protein